MGNRASSSSKNLSEICQEIIEWRFEPYWTQEKADIPWTNAHLSALVDYVLKLEGISISQFTAPNNTVEDWHPNFEPQNHKKIAKMVATFTQDLRKLLEMPKLQRWSDKENTLKKNELVAAFISFLLQLLYHRTDSMNSFADRIDSLEKELKFLVTVLGDTPFTGTAELEQVKNLLDEFEVVANDAGRLVYHIVFLRVRLFKSVRIKKALDALLKRVDLLKVNIGQFLDQLPFISNAAMTPKTVYVNSLIIHSLLDDLENLMSQEGDLTVHVKLDQIEILIQELTLSQSLFKAIKVPPHSEIEKLNESVEQISDMAYEAEYVVNSFLAGDVPHWYLTSRLTNIIHKIKTLLQELKTNYDIGALRVTQDFSAQLSLQAKRNFEVDDITVGFEDNATDILDQLVGGTEHLEIISIIGMPGIGKTTFAKKIYNHPLVNYRFDRSSWCVVSQTYQRKRLLIDILLLSSKGDVNKNRIFEMEEENLIEHIYKSLKGRRYLVVMDDIWDSNLWIDLWKCFPDDENGSRILFTSRDKYVAPPNTKIYPLPFLSNDQCWELLKQKVFRDEPCPPQLLSIGKEIATNCHGLPLAVVIIAGILSTMDKKKSTWKNVRESLASYIFSEQNSSMIRILQLSYKHLPEHLKPCFLYFGAFSEDREIRAKKLMRLWIAEGFIRKEEKKSAEIVAEEYLMELIDKSLVMVVERRWDGGVKACVVHDLLLDLCLKISQEANFLKLVDDSYSLYEKGQRLLSLEHSPTPFGHQVRSFHGYRLELPFYVGSMKLLRVLEFKTMISSANLIGFESLAQLRYLVINKLPESIGNLGNLEFLIVETDYDVYIPPAIVKMKKLRYLHAIGATFHEDCDSSQSNNMEFLAKVIIVNLKDEEMLTCSPHLVKLKCEFYPLCVEDNEAYRYPDLCFLTQLESLEMTTTHINRRHISRMMDINFPSNLKKLTLDGLRLPWEKMSIIGVLPKLQVLILRYRAFVGRIWETRDGEFQQLRFLNLDYIELEQWNVSSSEHFPTLRRLVLHSCHYLKEIPSEIGEIAALQSIEIESCPKSVGESAMKIEQEQRDMGNEELKVYVRYLLEGWHWFDDYDVHDDDMSFSSVVDDSI